MESKKMPAHKVGRQWKFKIQEVDEWVMNDGATND
nr:excisionase family DNA-binding protein [Halobacteriovorax sp. HLS]